MPASLTDIDKNFAVETACNLSVRFYPTRMEPFSLHGLYAPQEEGPFRRLPAACPPTWPPPPTTAWPTSPAIRRAAASASKPILPTSC